MPKKADTTAQDSLLRCSFCNKSQFEIRKLVAARLATICDDCVRVCVDILNDERSPNAAEAPGERIGWPGEVYCSLCRMELGDDAIQVDGRGLVCRPCANGVQHALGRVRKADP